MGNRGVAAVAAMWICLAAAAIALAALDFGRRSGRRAASREALVRRLFSGGEMVVALHADALSSDELQQPPERGGARAARRFGDDHRTALVRITFGDGFFTDVGWKREGDAWQVDFWREQ